MSIGIGDSRNRIADHFDPGDARAGDVAGSDAAAQRRDTDFVNLRQVRSQPSAAEFIGCRRIQREPESADLP